MKKTLAAIPLLLLLLLVNTLHLAAQEQFTAPPAKKLTTFSFRMLTGGIIILSATLDNLPDSLNFVFDTGSGGISLDSSTVERLKLPRVKTQRVIRGIAGVKEVEFTYGHSLNLPGLRVDSLDFHINDYELLTSVYGYKIDGIVGYSFLRRYLVYIDYDRHEMTVYTPGTIKYPRGGFIMRPQFTTLPMQGVAVRDARRINGRFYFDTGAGLCMLFSEDFLEDSAFLRKKSKIYKTQGEGLGGKAPMGLTVVKEIKVGPYRFRKVPVYLFKDEYNVTSYPMLGGVIGNDILRRFNVYLNYPEQMFYLKPNSHFNDAFDYSYTGLGIYMIEDRVTIVDVLTGSPGEKAGFRPGDIIVGIDNNISGDIQAYKTMLQHAGAKLKVIVNRGGELLVLNLHIKDIR